MQSPYEKLWLRVAESMADQIAAERSQDAPNSETVRAYSVIMHRALAAACGKLDPEADTNEDEVPLTDVQPDLTNLSPPPPTARPSPLL